MIPDDLVETCNDYNLHIANKFTPGKDLTNFGILNLQAPSREDTMAMYDFWDGSVPRACPKLSNTWPRQNPGGI